MPGASSPSSSAIVALLPRGETFRNFVYSEILERVGRELPLQVLSVYPNDRLRALLQDRFEDVDELREVEWGGALPYVREVLEWAHGRRLWSEGAQARWRLRMKEAASLRARAKVRAKQLLGRALGSQGGVDALARLEASLSRRSSAIQAYKDRFAARPPSLVFNASHVHSKIALGPIHAARALGIPTATFLFSWDNLTSQGRVYPDYDHYFAWTPKIASDLRRIYPGIRSDQIVVTGTPQFDAHRDPSQAWTRDRTCAELGADPARPFVYYTAGMGNHMPNEPLVIEGLARALDAMESLGRPQLVVRIYAKDRQPERFNELKAKRPDILFPSTLWETRFQTPLPEDGPLFVNALRHCAVGVNIASTVSLELCLLDRPVINVGYQPAGAAIGNFDYCDYYDFVHYRPVVESGAVELARSEEEMADMIRQALTRPERLRSQRAALIESFFEGFLDGRSGERIVDALTSIARRRGRVDGPPETRG